MASQIPVEKPASSIEESNAGYTIETLKAHSTRESFYMLLHDKVYDVTKFLDEVGFGFLLDMSLLDTLNMGGHSTRRSQWERKSGSEDG